MPKGKPNKRYTQELKIMVLETMQINLTNIAKVQERV
jgi:hypothetical protein